MEGKSYKICLDPALYFLENLNYPDEIHDDYFDDSFSDFSNPCSSENSYACYGDYSHLTSSIDMMILELSFLKMFLWGLAYCEELKYDWHMRFSIDSMLLECSQIAKDFEANCIRVDDKDQRINWDAMVYDLEKAIQQFKPLVKDICIRLLRGAFKCVSCPSKQKLFMEFCADTASFIVFIRHNMETLLNPDFDFISPTMKQQIVSIQQELGEFELIQFGMFANPFRRLCDLLSRSRNWYSCISCLVYLYWIDGKNDSVVSTMEALLSGLLHKMKPCRCSSSGVISSYFQGAIIPRLLASSIEFLLEDLVIPMRSDIEEGLIFLLSFILEPPEEDSENGEIIWAQIYGVINNIPHLIYSIRSVEIKGGIRKSNFSEFLLKIETAKAKVRELYLVTPYSTHFTSANFDVIGFLNLLIRYLKKMLVLEVHLIPSLKHLCELLRTELVLLGPIVNHIVELLLQGDEHKDLWKKLFTMIYNADYVIKFCLPRSFSVWYGIIALPDVIERIKLIKTEIGNIDVDKIHKKEKLTHYKEGTDALPQLRGTTSEIEGAFIGFKDLARVIIDELTRGAKSLTILSISGSAGQGKTTLAKRIYADPCTVFHFHRRVWCYISKECSIRDLLRRIICDVTEGDDRKKYDVKSLDLQGLTEHLRKCLKGKRYLIVMDDIWDVEVWCNLKWSFPDDKNGSRILFTSRNHDLALQAKPNSMSHRLPLFSDEESWELMKNKVFGCDVCPSEFLEIGEKIASYCKGLPLAVVLIAAILGKTERKLDLWDGVAENLKSHLAREGCGNVIELSYKYLPDHLKPCFLYFGVFSRGKNVRAKKLKLLWISEGFISQDHETQSSDEDLATDYLNNLASLSLVRVTKRSSMGGIKRCNVHDLLYDLCLEKAKEENFLVRAEESSVFDILSHGKLHKYNHIRLRVGVSDPFIKLSHIATEIELPTSSLHSLLWSSNSYFIDSSFDLLENLKVLTVLDLDFHHVPLEFGQFPEVILSMIHLRYLALRSLHCIFEIPPEISNLWNLETLIISHISITPILLPVSMWKMKSLRHVDIERAHLDLEDFDLNGSACSNIETLGALHLVCNSRTVEFLRHFPKLRKLNCSFQGEEHNFKPFSMFGSLTQLESLKVCHPEWLDRVSYDKKAIFDFPVRIENLKKLVLNGLQLPWSVVSMIGKQLPNLEVLKLLSDACLGSSWKLEDGDLLKLRYLKLSYLQEIKEIDVSDCYDNLPFPCLEHLFLVSCPKLEEIPSVFGEICGLKTLITSLCSEGVQTSVLRILEQQRELGNSNLVLLSAYLVELN